jgi:sialic acid synthase SpsE
MSPSSECFIIAEIGSNWNSLTDCLTAISMAKVVGADAVKFQLFDFKALYGMDIGEGHHVMVGALPPEWLPKLKEKADAVGIELMCTFFSPEDVKKYDHLLTRHKIASSDLTYPQLLEVIRDTGKPVVLSVGASNVGDINRAICILGDCDFTLTYCVSSYPSYDHNLFEINSLAQHFGAGVGYSDHSKDIYAPVSAWHHFGCPIIEKHYNPLELDTPDAPHSIDTPMFQEMVKRIRQTTPFEFSPKPSEKDMFLRHNRRLIAIKDIKAGDTFEYGVNFGCYRSLQDDARGLSGFHWGRLNGKIATRDFSKGSGVT